VIDCHVALGLGLDPSTADGHQWRGGSRGASLGGTRLVVVAWKPSAWATTGTGAAERGDISALVVLDGYRLAGIITERDVVRAPWPAGGSWPTAPPGST
jgi:CBS domain-containing protein